MMAVQSEKILAEIDDVIRSLPPAIRQGSINDEALRWLGRARAIMYQWDRVRATEFNIALGNAAIRLLATRYLNKLLPAVQLFRQTSSMKIEVRSAPDFHDRFVFIDRHACFHSSGILQSWRQERSDASCTSE